VTDAAGVKISEARYKPWGEVRYSTVNSTLPTRYTYTGQYSYISDSATDLGANASFGLMYYNARWFDNLLGRFTQPDTIVRGGVQGLDRYAYVNNSPLLSSQCTSLGILCRVVGKDEPFELLSGADAIGEQFFCF
jgi:RHS repeat-associated protein